MMRINLTGVDPTTGYELRFNGNKVAGKLSHPSIRDMSMWTDPERYEQPALQEGSELEIVHEHLGVLETVAYQEGGVVEVNAHKAQLRARIAQMEAELQD